MVVFLAETPSVVQELLPQNTLSRPASNLQVHGPQLSSFQANGPTPLSPNFPISTVAANVSPESLSRWTETTAMMLSNPVTTESSNALTALGDCLAANQWTEAAHVW
jgi:hypothetical protein